MSVTIRVEKLMPESATIASSFFEYTVEFEQTIIALWLDRAKMVQSVFDALEPWGMDVDGVEGRNEGKPANQGFAFRLPNHHATFFFGPVKATFTRAPVDWSEAGEIIKLLDAALAALLRSTNAIVKKQKTTLVLHLQPKTLDFRDMLAKFWPPQVMGLHSEMPKTGAVILRWRDAGITIDGSASVKNGVFLKLEREFDREISYEQIAEVLRKDENEALAVLGLEVEEG